MAILDEVAERAGVSRSTVARALRCSDKRKWASTDRRIAEIRRIAEAMGYRPNAAARATATGRHNAISLLMRGDMDFLPPDLLRGILDGLADQRMQLTLTRAGGNPVASAVSVRELPADGLLIHEALDIPAEVVRTIRRYKVPAVWINAKQSRDAVYVDEQEITRRLTQRLIELGHRRICYPAWRVDWGTGQEHYCFADRQRGYEQAMKAARLAPWILEWTYRAQTWDRKPWGTAQDDRLARAKQVLQGRGRPTAVLTAGTDDAQPFLLAALSLGLQIPAELSLVTLSHESVADLGVPLSAAISPMRQVGEAAAAMLLKKLASDGKAQGAQTVLYGECVGDTIAPCPVRRNGSAE